MRMFFRSSVTGKKIPIEIMAEWVKAHQIKPTNRAARLNNDVDRLTASQHNKNGSWASKNSARILLHTQAQLLIQGVDYTSKNDQKIQGEIYRSKLRGYLVEKINLSNSQHLID